MNLGELLDFCGNLLDYDPSNGNVSGSSSSVPAERCSDTGCLTDRPWAFASSERTLQVWTDTTHQSDIHQRAAAEPQVHRFECWHHQSSRAASWQGLPWSSQTTQG